MSPSYEENLEYLEEVLRNDASGLYREFWKRTFSQAEEPTQRELSRAVLLVPGLRRRLTQPQSATQPLHEEPTESSAPGKGATVKSGTVYPGAAPIPTPAERVSAGAQVLGGQAPAPAPDGPTLHTMSLKVDRDGWLGRQLEPLEVAMGCSVPRKTPGKLVNSPSWEVVLPVLMASAKSEEHLALILEMDGDADLGPRSHPASIRATECTWWFGCKELGGSTRESSLRFDSTEPTPGVHTYTTGDWEVLRIPSPPVGESVRGRLEVVRAGKVIAKSLLIEFRSEA